MNNNRNQNNRRRGRGNRNQGGGGNQGNRIDSRARGNAPQLLDKYKKLAEDAHRNGDRVQAEYYLQFADHYFRVIADNRSRQDEQRGGERFARRDDRDQDEFDGEEAGEFGGAADFGGERRPEPRDRDNRERDGADRNARDRDGRERNAGRDGRRERAPREEQFDEAGMAEAGEGPAFEPDENPFTRDAREPRADRPKRRAPRARRSDEEDAGIDAAALPPAFSANDAFGAGDAEAAAPAPRPRRKRGEGGTLSAVG